MAGGKFVSPSSPFDAMNSCQFPGHAFIREDLSISSNMLQDGGFRLNNPFPYTVERFAESGIFASSQDCPLYAISPLQENIVASNNISDPSVSSDHMGVHMTSESSSSFNSALTASANFPFGSPNDASGASHMAHSSTYRFTNPVSYAISDIKNAVPSYGAAKGRDSSLYVASLPDQFSEVGCSGSTFLTRKDNLFPHGMEVPTSPMRHNPFGELYLQNKEASFRHDLPRRPNFCGPLNSSYLCAAQEILAEFSSYALQGLVEGSDSVRELEGEKMPRFASSCDESAMTGTSSVDLLEPSEQAKKFAAMNIEFRDVSEMKVELLRMLEQVDEKYMQCLEEIQNVTSKINHHRARKNVCAPFAHSAISSLCKNLKERIGVEILFIDQQSNMDSSSDKKGSFGDQWTLQRLKKNDPRSWRPQRGLPEKCVSVLRAWLFQNFLRPYPSDHDKELLAMRSGLTKNQVSNWFINARVRLWKPLIEEMYSEIKRSNQSDNVSPLDGYRSQAKFSS